ncbi:MAG: ATP-binding protein [Magnetospirillum sp.]|nr:ATP-binding protein [Magnetospirillum sp.]
MDAKSQEGAISTKTLRRTIVVYTALALAAISLLVAVASISPLAVRLRKNAQDTYRHALALKVMAAEEYLSRARGLTQQITSRVAINQQLEAVENGKLSLTQASEDISGRLAYALRLSPEMEGIVRLDARGNVVSSVGMPFPWRDATLPQDHGDPVISCLADGSGKPLIIAAAPVSGHDGRRIGTDFMLIDTAALQAIVKGTGVAGRSGDTALISGGQTPRVIVPYRGDAAMAPGAEEIRTARMNRRDGDMVVDARRGRILVTQGIPGTDWTMMMRVNAHEATADVDRLILTVTAGALGLTLIGVLGLLMVLRPLTGGFIVQANDMRRQIDELEKAKSDLDEKSRRLTRTNAQLQEYAYAASHDLQEPLRTVTSFAQLLSKRYRGHLDSEADEFIDFIVEGAHRMHGRVNDLLAYARLDGEAGEGFQAVDMDSVLGEVVAGLGASITEKSATVEARPLPRVQGNRAQLGALLQNLIANAIKFAKPGQAPHVTISGQRHGTRVEILVRDEGIGIDPAFQDRIFQMFKRLHPPGTYEGSGIGLAMCRRVAENHGGRIWVDSHPGDGATFHVVLPAAD